MKKICILVSLIISWHVFAPSLVAAADCDGDTIDDSADHCCKDAANSSIAPTDPAYGCPTGTSPYPASACSDPKVCLATAPIATPTKTTTATTPTVSTGKTTLESPYGGSYAKDPKAVIAVVLQALLGIVGAATLLMFIWGGFRLIFSEGNEEKITKSKAILVWATVGLAVVMASYSILSYAFTLIQKAATGAI